MKKVLIAVIAGVFVLGMSMSVTAQEEATSEVIVAAETVAVEAIPAEEVVAEPVEADPVAEEVAVEQPVEVPASEAVPQEKPEGLYTYGNVVTSGEGTIVVMEYDFENDKDVEISYAINDTTVFQNLGGLVDVQANDEVEIMYEEADGQRVAKMVSKTVKE